MDNKTFLALFLKQNLERVRQEVGNKLKYISYAEFKVKGEDGEWTKTNGFKITVLAEDGSRHKIEVALNKPYSSFMPKDFQDLIDLIKNGEYERTETV